LEHKPVPSGKRLVSQPATIVPTMTQSAPLPLAKYYDQALMDSSVPTAELAALLGRGTQFEGKLCFEGRVRIDCAFKGEILSNDTLVIGDGADIEAEITVSTLIVRGGRVKGELRARNCIELYVPAEVNGSLHAPEIYMDKGVQFSGTCTMAPLDE
jgi:cytoskeletal protein CcmA (bactofilin family)